MPRGTGLPARPSPKAPSGYKTPQQELVFAKTDTLQTLWNHLPQNRYGFGLSFSLRKVLLHSSNFQGHLPSALGSWRWFPTFLFWSVEVLLL